MGEVVLVVKGCVVVCVFHRVGASGARDRRKHGLRVKPCESQSALGRGLHLVVLHLSMLLGQMNMRSMCYVLELMGLEVLSMEVTMNLGIHVLLSDSLDSVLLRQLPVRLPGRCRQR